MIFLRVFTIFLLIYAYYNYETEAEEQNLLNYVCRVSQKFSKIDNDTKDVAIGYFRSNLTVEFYNVLAFCVSRYSVITTSDFGNHTPKKHMRKAKLVILITDDLSLESISNIYFKNALTPKLDHMAKLIFVVGHLTPWVRKVADIFKFFFTKGFLDIIITTEFQNQIITYAHRNYGLVIVLYDVDDPKQLFPDHLKDLRGYNYRVPFYNQVRRIRFQNNNLVSPWFYFMSAIATKQNAKIHAIFIRNRSDLFALNDNRELDFTINAGNYIQTSYPMLLTYEETGTCALIPRDQSNLFFLILIKPFNWKIWLAFFGTLLATAILWRLFKNHGAEDSVWRLVAGLLAFFLGQSIAFRNNHRMLMTVVQIFIFAMLILGCLYQGQITSSMIEPDQVKGLSSFDELFDSDLKIIVDEAFNVKMRESESYARAKPRVNVTGHLKLNFSYTELFQKRVAMIMPCPLAEYEKMNRNGSQYYYLLDDRILNHYNMLAASYLNPFLERLQLFMDWSFEAGLPYAWKLFTAELLGKFSITHEREYLELEDLVQVFKILLIGQVAATVVFFLEIFVHWRNERNLLKVHKIYIIGEKRKLQLAQAANKSSEVAIE